MAVLTLGPLSPTITSQTSTGKTAWNGINNVFVADGLRATVSRVGGSQSETYRISGFQANIPLSATIVGVEFSVLCRSNGISPDHSRLLVAGSEAGTALPASDFWDVTDSVVLYGSPTFTGGLSITPAVVNATDFGISFQTSLPLFTVFGINHVTLTVYYTNCPEPVLDDHGRESIAVDQPQGGSNFPFVQPSEDIQQLIGDAYLAYVDNTCQYVRPFRIAWLAGFGCAAPGLPFAATHDHDVLIVDAEDTTVFDSRTATYREQAWGDRLLVLEWYTTDEVLRIVKHIAWSPEHEPVDYGEYIEPENGILDDNVLEHVPPHVRSIRVGLDVMQSNIQFRNGYNTDIITSAGAQPDGGRFNTSVRFDAEPTRGLGRFPPNCGDNETAILRINGLEGNSRGNFLLDAYDCYRIQRPIHEVLNESPREVRIRNHALQLFNDCGPCCDCTEFVAVYEAIRRMRDRYAELVARAQIVRDIYAANRQRYLDQLDCRDQNRLRLVLQPHCPLELGVAAGYCNNSDVCLPNLLLFISFSHTESSCGINFETPFVESSPPYIPCNSSFRSGDASAATSGREPYTVGGEWPYYWAFFNAVNPGSLGATTFRLVFDGATDLDQLNVSAVADAFTLPSPLSLESGQPLPGYTPGMGPDPTVVELRLAQCPRLASTTLLTAEDCGDCT